MGLNIFFSNGRAQQHRSKRTSPQALVATQARSDMDAASPSPSLRAPASARNSPELSASLSITEEPPLARSSSNSTLRDSTRTNPSLSYSQERRARQRRV